MANKNKDAVSGDVQEPVGEQQVVAGPTPMPEPEGGWPADEFTGIGGNYVRDPFTGIRRKADALPD